MAREVGIRFELGAALDGSFGTATGAATGHLRGISQSIRDLERQPVGRLGDKLQQQRDKLRGLGTSLRDAQGQLATLKARSESTGGVTGLLARQIQQAESRVQGLRGQLDSTSQSYRNSVAAATTAAGSVRALSAAYQELQGKVAEQRREQERVTASLEATKAADAKRSALRGTVQAAPTANAAKLAVGADLVSQKEHLRGLGTSLRETQGQLAALKERASASGGATGLLARQIQQGEAQVSALHRELRSGSAVYRETAAVAASLGGSIRGLTQDYRHMQTEAGKAAAAQLLEQERDIARAETTKAADAKRSALRGTVQAAPTANAAKLAVGADLVSQKEHLRGLGTSLRETQGQLAALKERASASGGATGLLARQIQQGEAQVSALHRELRSGSAVYRETAAVAASLGGSIRGLTQDYRHMQTEAGKAAAAQARLGENRARMDALRGKRDELNSRMLTTTAQAATVVVPVKLAISAEDTFASLKKVMGDVPDDMLDAVFTDAKKLSQASGKSFEEVVTIMTAAAQAGLGKTRDEMLAIADQAVKMSVAWGVSADQAGGSLATWRSSMNLTADQANRMADVINALSNEMKGEAGEVDQIFTRMGPLLKGTGFAVQDIAALGMAFKASGAQVEVAGTAMKNFTRVMSAGSSGLTDTQQGIYNFLKIDPNELQKQMQTDAKGAVMRVLNALSNVKPEQRNAVAMQLFGQESIAAIAPLLENMGLLEKAFDIANSNVDGSVQEEYQNRMKTTATEVAKLTQSTRNLGITTGKALLPVMTPVIKGLTFLVQKGSELAERYPGATAALMTGGAVMATLAVGGLGLGLVINGVQTSLTALRGVTLLSAAAQNTHVASTVASTAANLTWGNVLAWGRGIIGGAGAALATYTGIQRGATLGTIFHTTVTSLAGTAMNIMAVGTKVLTFAMRGLAFAFGPVGIGIMGLGILAGWLVDNWDTVGPYFSALWDGIVDTFKGAYDFISGIISSMINGIASLGEAIDDVPVLGSAKRGIGKAWDWAFGDGENKKQDAPSPTPTADAAKPRTTAAMPVVQPVAEKNNPVPSTSGTADMPAFDGDYNAFSEANDKKKKKGSGTGSAKKGSSGTTIVSVGGDNRSLETVFIPAGSSPSGKRTRAWQKPAATATGKAAAPTLSPGNAGTSASSTTTTIVNAAPLASPLASTVTSALAPHQAKAVDKPIMPAAATAQTQHHTTPIMTFESGLQKATQALSAFCAALSPGKPVPPALLSVVEQSPDFFKNLALPRTPALLERIPPLRSERQEPHPATSGFMFNQNFNLGGEEDLKQMLQKVTPELRDIVMRVFAEWQSNRRRTQYAQ